MDAGGEWEEQGCGARGESAYAGLPGLLSGPHTEPLPAVHAAAAAAGPVSGRVQQCGTPLHIPAACCSALERDGEERDMRIDNVS